MFEGALEEQLTTGGFLNQDYQRTGIHSHDDGLMHWHPFSSASVGQRAKLGLFLENYGVGLTNTELTFPEAQVSSPDFPAWNEDGVFEEGTTTCTVDGVEQDAELKVVVWNNYTDTDDGTTYIADFENIKLNQDQMVVSIAFVPPGTSVGMPPWAENLPDLSLNDMSQLRPEDIAGTTGTDVSVPPSDTVAADPSSTVAADPSSTVAEVPASTDG
jgi:hypothetical protein